MKALLFFPDLHWSLYCIRWEENVAILRSVSCSLLGITEFSIAETNRNNNNNNNSCLDWAFNYRQSAMFLVTSYRTDLWC